MSAVPDRVFAIDALAADISDDIARMRAEYERMRRERILLRELMANRAEYIAKLEGMLLELLEA